MKALLCLLQRNLICMTGNKKFRLNKINWESQYLMSKSRVKNLKNKRIRALLFFNLNQSLIKYLFATKIKLRNQKPLDLT